MLPFKFSKDTALGSASPSISMEKGTYRMRAPPLPRLPLSPHPKPILSPRHRRSQSADSNAIPTPMLALVAVLIFACISSFGFAYYLFTTRWEAQVDPQLSTFVNESLVHEATSEEAYRLEMVPDLSQHLEMHGNYDTDAWDDLRIPTRNYTEPEERFLAYLPHSGFHNQRVALENALILSHILNRTLLVPDARLGGKPIPHSNFTGLYEALMLAEATDLDCITAAGSKATVECSSTDTPVHVQWEHLVDWQSISPCVKTRRRTSMAKKWIEDSLRVTPAEIEDVHDYSLYQYCILEGNNALIPDKCSEPIYVEDLLASEKQVIHFGSLFGFSRLSLRSPHYIEVRRRIRRGMVIKNPQLLQAANFVVEHVGEPYLAVHLRLSEKFESRQQSILRATWWELVRGVLQYSTTETARLARDFGLFNSTEDLDVEAPDIMNDARTRRPSRVDLGVLRPSSHRALQGCPGKRHVAPHRALLNTPLFIATDIPNPRFNSTLQAFHQTFPCAYFLSDFSDVPLGPPSVFLPFVDAVVAGKAVAVVGTMGSTFSAYVQDILWPSYHDRDVMVIS